MKKKSTLCIIAAALFAALNLQAQIPNGGFENWTAGNPDNWLTYNIPGFAITITQATPPYSGTFAARGEVVTTPGGAITPLLTSTDQSGNGFAVTQAYTNFSLYYKLNTSGTTAFAVSAIMYDAGGNFVGSGGQLLTGIVNSYSQLNIPIYYLNTNPVECVITILLADTVGSNPVIGNYFIVDNLTLSGTTGIEQLNNEKAQAFVYPNPANNYATITLDNPVSGIAEMFLYDLKGSVIKQVSTEMTAAARYEWMFSVSELPSGIYLARVTCADKQWLTKIVKN